LRLHPDTLHRLNSAVVRPSYNRKEQATGIVHLGIGAFHRAHQAVYTDDAMNAGDRDWGILGVSLRSGAVRDQLGPQDGLYTVSRRASDVSDSRLIGSVARVLVGPEHPDAVVDALASPSTRLVTLTVTEKGYQQPPQKVIKRMIRTGGSNAAIRRPQYTSIWPAGSDGAAPWVSPASPSSAAIILPTMAIC
jgi:fructuronate reductase